MFVFLPASTRTRIISSNLVSYFSRLLFYGNITTARFIPVFFIGAIFLACGIYLVFISLYLPLITFLLAAFFQLRILLLHRNRKWQQGDKTRPGVLLSANTCKGGRKTSTKIDVLRTLQLKLPSFER